MLMVSRIGKRFVTLIYMTLLGVIFLLMGNWFLLPYFIVTGVICEVIPVSYTHLVLKADVVAVGIIFGQSGHALFALDLPHTLDAHLAGKNRCHVGKHGADGVIYPGGGDMEHQKRDQRQVAAAHECHPREDSGGDAQL